jgi:N-acetylmuramoyl-L-alanine amidase CwlA
MLQKFVKNFIEKWIKIKGDKETMKTVDVSTIGKAKVIVDIVDKGNYEIRPEYEMNPDEIAVHNTGNSGRGAGAKAHNVYIHNQAKLPVYKTGYASWHFSVDDLFIYQHIPLDESAWATGDGGAVGSGNRRAIQIEICENVDMENYAQAEENAIALIKYLIEKLNINVQKVKPHQAYSGKHCPRVILNRDGSFSKFHARVEKAVKGKVTVTKPKPVSSDVYGMRVESIYKGKEGLDFYSKATFNDKYKAGVLQYGYGFTVIEKVAVEGSYMYKVKNSKGQVFYMTTYSKYVKLEGKGKPAPVVKPKPKPVSSDIPILGSIKVNKVNSFTYIYADTSDKSARLGKAYKNSTLHISGSTSEFYEVIFKGKRAYVKVKYASRVH